MLYKKYVMKNYDFKALFMRILIAGGTGFLSAFSHQYATTPDLHLAINAGIAALAQWAAAGLGLNQLIVHYDQTKAAAQVAALKAQSKN